MTSSEVIPELLKACPTFAPEWKRLQEDGDHELLYVGLGAFARHLLTLTRDENYEELSAAAAFIERMHVKGDGQVREAATIGVLEGIQNGWSNKRGQATALPRQRLSLCRLFRFPRELGVLGAKPSLLGLLGDRLFVDIQAQNLYFFVKGGGRVRYV